MDKLEAFRTIALQAGQGELTFPTNVNASLKIKRMLDNPDCNLASAGQLLMTEPLIAARALAMANSATYNRSGGEITKLSAAVMRLGLRTLQSLVAAEIVRQFASKITDPAIRSKAAQLWEHTAHVAALAHVIARRVTNVDPETAMFAGIIHEIGGFYLLSRAHDFPGVLDVQSEGWLEFGEKAIGRRVLTKLSMPEAVIAAVESLWFGEHNRPPVTLGDTLMLANDLAPVASPLHKKEGATHQPATTIIDFEVGEETLQSILLESADEIKALVASLMT
ncbi:MAG TPA: HDOD domain-containing protein [Burkholderiaceae bacterium]|jgi:HD-like signal output (HDOD) protein